jgi:23S rRNA (guanosine2251-2'-O)-methyltransferase
MKKHSRKSLDGVWISGVNQSLEALRADGIRVREIILARTDDRIQEIVDRAAARGIPVRRESRDTLSTILGHVHHQGVALLTDEFPYTPLDAILERPLPEREPLIVLDLIQDPQNFGAILRSGCFLGARGVVIPKDRSARVTQAVIKVAAGATAYVSVSEVTNLVRTLDELKEAGLWVVGLDVQAEQSIYNADLTSPLALVVGSEHKGLRHLIRAHCDLMVTIPARGPLDSLNAATACAVALAEVQRQRAERAVPS